jgi:hypothetical protein
LEILSSHARWCRYTTEAMACVEGLTAKVVRVPDGLGIRWHQQLTALQGFWTSAGSDHQWPLTSNDIQWHPMIYAMTLLRTPPRGLQTQHLHEGLPPPEGAPREVRRNGMKREKLPDLQLTSTWTQLESIIYNQWLGWYFVAPLIILEHAKAF